jgi:hypothetical protein
LPLKLCGNWSEVNESNSIHQETLRSLQSSEAQGQAVCDLQQPEAQAAPRLGDAKNDYGSY